MRLEEVQTETLEGESTITQTIGRHCKTHLLYCAGDENECVTAAF